MARAGSRDEPAEWAGVSHFLEHMCFKGTRNCPWQQITIDFDNMGAYYNAFTSREHTFYFGWVRRADIDRQIELLSDMVRPSLPQARVRHGEEGGAGGDRHERRRSRPAHVRHTAREGVRGSSAPLAGAGLQGDGRRLDSAEHGGLPRAVLQPGERRADRRGQCRARRGAADCPADDGGLDERGQGAAAAGTHADAHRARRCR